MQFAEKVQLNVLGEYHFIFVIFRRTVGKMYTYIRKSPITLKIASLGVILRAERGGNVYFRIKYRFSAFEYVKLPKLREFQ